MQIKGADNETSTHQEELKDEDCEQSEKDGHVECRLCPCSAKVPYSCCHELWYCSPTCHNSHWSQGHKHQCSKNIVIDCLNCIPIPLFQLLYCRDIYIFPYFRISCNCYSQNKARILLPVSMTEKVNKLEIKLDYHSMALYICLHILI